MVRQIVDSEPALREQEILHRSAVAFRLGFSERKKLRVIAHPGGELNVVCFNPGVGLLKFGDGVFVLVEEHRAAVVVEGGPEEGLAGEAEDEKIRSRVLNQSDGDGGELGGRHGFGSVVGGGGIVEESSGNGGGKRTGGGRGGGGGGGGLGEGEGGGAEGEDEEESEEDKE